MPAIIYDRDTVIGRTACPHCHAERGHSCWSAYLGRPMVHQVHAERYRAAVDTRPGVR